MSAAILTDVTKCIGCRECVVACKAVNRLAPDVPRHWHKDDGLSSQNWTSIVERPNQHFIRKQCLHCIEPACASACPVKALHQTPEGIVVYDSHKCIGCRYCMIACPYGIPRYDWEKPVPYIQKCTMCYDRIKIGKQPACTTACPTKATIFGDRDELLAEAHRRIKENPGKYINTVYGEFEVGGTSVLYISDIDLGFLSYPVAKLGTEPLPETTRTSMEAVPFTFVGVGVLMGGLHWLVKRRQKLQLENEESEE